MTQKVGFTLELIQKLLRSHSVNKVKFVLSGFPIETKAFTLMCALVEGSKRSEAHIENGNVNSAVQDVYALTAIREYLDEIEYLLDEEVSDFE